MKIIIAPAKKMIVDTDSFEAQGLPQYIDEAQVLIESMRSLSYEQAKNVWQTSEKIARTSYQRLQQTNLREQLTPALLAYSGIQYQYMAPDLFTAGALEYVQNNLRILSGLYGILKPFDGIVPYRLEMQSKIPGVDNLYQYWDRRLYDALTDDNGPIINLASKEYSKAVSPYLLETTPMIDITFASLIDGKVKTRATLAKMARGEMVRFMAENGVSTINELKGFDHLDYKYSEELSGERNLTFIKQ